jgi:hypothetical protein
MMIPVTKVNVQANSKRSLTSPAMIRSPHTQATPSRSGVRPLPQSGGKATAACLNLGAAAPRNRWPRDRCAGPSWEILIGGNAGSLPVCVADGGHAFREGRGQGPA